MTMRVLVDGDLATEQTVVVDLTAIDSCAIDGRLDVGRLDPGSSCAIRVEVSFDPPVVVEIDAD